MKKSDLIVIASAKAKLGKEKELEEALRDVAEPTNRGSAKTDGRDVEHTRRAAAAYVIRNRVRL